MRFRLIPLACPELDVIDIRDALLGVGRDRGAFKRLSSVRAERLSNRHARLYDKDDALYVVDLGSQHGTFVNGQAVAAEPVELQDGDLIDFGGELPFRLELSEKRAEQVVAEVAETALILEPINRDNGPDPLRITSFPYLVSKESKAFAKYRDRVEAEVDFISRRHAQLSRQDGRILLQDLGSTNGTIVDGRPLGEDAAVLEDGQTVAFGGDYFVYRVLLQGREESPPPVEERPTRRPARPEVEKTTFVTAGSTFLDILCADDPNQAAKTEADVPAKPDDASGSAAKKRGRPALLSSLSRALQPRDPVSSRRLQALAVSVIAVLVAAGYLFLRESPIERMESLLESGRVDEVLEIARAEATALDGTTAFDRLSLRALISKTLAPWLDAHDAADFASMQEIVDAGREASPEQAGTLEYIETLSLIGDVRRTVSQRGGAAAPLRVFDEGSAPVQDIIEAWNRPIPDQRKVTQRIAGAVGPRDAVLVQRYLDAYQKAASDIRALKSQLAVYEPAVKQVESTIARHLTDGSLDDLATDLDRYAERYSQFRGFDELQRDLSNYRELVDASSQGRVLDAIRLATTAEFYAAPFAKAAEGLAGEQLPPKEFLDSYAAALESWRSGEMSAALAQLESLVGSSSGEIARREIQRMEGILRDVNAVQALERSPEYDERLLTLYHSLDSSHDEYILTLLRAEYEDSRAASQKRAHQAAMAAASAWADYRERGRITSTQRLQSGIGQDYKERAAILSQAGSAASEARRLYGQARVAMPQERKSTLTAIEREIALQHQALDELVGVLREATLQEKRALLPARPPNR